MPALSWILACAAFCLFGGAVSLLALRRRRVPSPMPVPAGAVSAVPVFDAVERRVFAELGAALPDGIVLARLPLSRFCRPADPAIARAHGPRLAALDVDFALCSASGRVLAAIDLERGDDPAGAETRREKAALLAASPVRYLRCAPETMPSVEELRRLTGAPAVTAPQRPARARPGNLWLDSLLPPAAAANDDPPLPPWVRPRRRASDRVGDASAWH